MMQIPRQMQVVQKQMKRELAISGAMPGEPLGPFQFHIPLFASIWGLLREACIVPARFSRAHKEVLGAAVSSGNFCRFCCNLHVSGRGDMGVRGMLAAWKSRSLVRLPKCQMRFKAILLWFRDSTRADFFRDSVRTLS
jgi:hypothetical protein